MTSTTQTSQAVSCCKDIERISDHTGKASADVIITRPPYHLYEEYNLYSHLKTILKPSGSLFLIMRGKSSEEVKPLRVISKICGTDIDSAGWVLQNHVIWVKSISLDLDKNVDNRFGQACYGRFKPVHSERFENNLFEHVFHLTKHGDITIDRMAIGVPYKDKSNIDRWSSASEDRRCRGNVWYVPEHPGFSTPVKLAETCIKFHGIKKDMLVVDPFARNGAVLLASMNLDVEAMGFVSEPYQCSAVKKVVSDAYNAMHQNIWSAIT